MNHPIRQLSDAEQQLALRLHQQELVASFGLFALRSADLDGVLDQACTVAAQGLGTAFAKVLEYRPATRDFLLRNGVGWRDGVVGCVVSGMDLASPAGFALHTKMPVVSNHLAAEARFKTPPVLADHGIHRAINVLVEIEGGVPFGVLEADSSNRHQFTVDDLSFMQSLANVLSAAITRQRLHAAQEALLREKDILMQEIHHRVKNNLQLVQTMLNLQARGIADSAEKSRLQEAAGRIMSIAAIHRRLEGAIARVDLAPYLDGLLADISDSLSLEPDARPITTDVDAMVLAPAEVTPVGLITVELVTNALKYGAGPIAVRVRQVERGVAISVEDEGQGFAPDFTPASRSSLGMRLIAALARTRDAITIGRHGDVTVITVRVTFSAAPAQA